jgi:hypothetical protein
LPEGVVGDVPQNVIARVSSEHNPLTHLLHKTERPFHHCDRSWLVQFAGGLTTVAMLAKCCPITDVLVLCVQAI